MSNDYYTAGAVPGTSAAGSSAVVRGEYLAVQAGFDKLAALTGAGNRIPYINSGATAQTTNSGFTFDGTTFTAPAINTPGALAITLTTDATSISTGASKNDGGTSITKALWVGGLTNIAGAVTAQSTLKVTGLSTLTGNATFAGAAGDGVAASADANSIMYLAATPGASSASGWISVSGSGHANAGKVIVNTGGASFVMQVSGVEQAHIDSVGDFVIQGSTGQKASGTTWANPSDKRLKDNVRDYQGGAKELMGVRVREWEYNGLGGTKEGMFGIGVVADEIEKILPGTVSTYKGRLNPDDENDCDIKRFDATEITWLMVNVVQSHESRLNAMRAELDA